MALRTYNIYSNIASPASMTAKEVATLATATNALARAVVAFIACKAGPVKATAFASIAGVARVSYDDAMALVASSVKGSMLRVTISAMRAEVVKRIQSCSVVHDAAEDAATVRCYDKIVSALVTLDKERASIVREEVEVVEQQEAQQ
jgi:hypothetical protein